MRNPRDFLKPLAIGAPLPPREVVVKPSRMIHFFDPGNERMRARVPEMAQQVDVLLGNLEDAVAADRKLEARACFLGALNLFHSVAPNAEDPFDALSAALAGIRGLRPPSPTLFLWEVALDVRQLPAFKMADFLLLVLAPNRNSAIGYANEIFAAMHPGGPPIETILRCADRADLEPPDSATEPGIVDWRGRR